MADLRSNIEWKLWGKDDPLFGVASWNKRQKGAESEWTDEEFYALGESDWRDFVRHWQHYGVNKKSCLEVGCGAGRITRQLALSFERVYAVDVSDAMIAYARERVGAANVEYSLVDGLSLPYEDCSINSIFSTHVLQHLDNVDIGLSYFTEFYRVLAIGGTIMVHLPIYQWPHEAGRAAFALKAVFNLVNKIDDLKAYYRRKKGVKIMRNTMYPFPRLDRDLRRMGFQEVELRIFQTTSNGGLHPFILATK